MPKPASNLPLGLDGVAQHDPHRLALSDSEETLTYGELLEAAGGLASSIPDRTDESPGAVALLMPHRAPTIVAIAAALLAGRPYCLLNPDQPRRRIEALLAAVEPELTWVSDPDLLERLEAVGHQAAVPERTASSSRKARRSPATATELCALYVTSGTSGTPKLVRYRRQATRHRAERYAAAIRATPDDRFALASPLWTAAAASALFTALLSGASLHLLEPGRMGPAALSERVAKGGITVWHSTPSLFRRLGGAGVLDGNRFRVLRLGGEPLLPTDIELARRICTPQTLLVTGYSLTEANGAVTQKAVPLDACGAETVLDAGWPVPGVDLRIDHGNGGPPSGVEEGEIVVGGDLLSAGYSQGEEAGATTRFEHHDGNLVLHTGDHGVLRADGSLQVLGRDDERLKIRGHRVDPTEVEAAALRHGGVLDAAVVPFTPAAGDSVAIALFVLGGPGPIPLTAGQVRAHLAEEVAPEAMPASVRVLDRFPLTASGKVDRRRLARTALRDGRARLTRRERTDPLVEHLRLLMRGALEVDELQPDEDFFALGGDSLAAVEVCAGVESVFGIPMEPAALLRHRSARTLAERVRHVVKHGPGAVGNVLELNPAGKEPPLFVVPGAGSEATALVHLAEALGPDQPLNVIQLPGVDGQSRPLTRMDQIAAHCVEAVRESDVEPPFRVAGTSFGGLVAYAAASKLLQEGVEIEYLGLFDTPGPMIRRSGYLLDPLRRFRASSRLSARRAARSPRAELRRLRGPLRRMLDNYRLTFSLLLGGRWRPPIELRFRYLRTACAIAADRWTPADSPLPFYLYRCNSQPGRLADAPLLGWEGHASQVTVRAIPSTHGRHIRPPTVGHLAAMVGSDLAASRSRLPARAGAQDEAMRWEPGSRA